MMELEDYKTENEKIAFLEGMAKGIWNLSTSLKLVDGHCKSYDPLTIEKQKGVYMVHSYVYEFGIEGRHNELLTLEQVRSCLWNEIKWLKTKNKFDEEVRRWN